MKAYATRGETGHRLYAGLDTAGGIRPDNSYKETALARAKPSKYWGKCMLVNLINSQIIRINMLASTIANDGFAPLEHCEFNLGENNRTIFIRIKNKEYRMQKQTISIRKI